MLQLLLNTILPDSLNPATYSLITYAIYGIFILILLYYLFKERRNISHKTLNKYIIDVSEIMPTVSYFSYPAETIQHIFWSGGPHSTALLCYCLIVLGQPVQPIFFTDSICSGNLKNIKRVRKILTAKYPHLQSRLLPTWYVASVDKHRDITGLFAQMNKLNPELSDKQLAKWDACARFAYSDDTALHTFMMANTAESPLFTGANDNLYNIYNKIFTEKLKNKIVFPHAHMTHDGVKQLALDSKNYYWDIIKLYE